MAYENYTQVSWSSGTPITGDRLQQMSQNIQEVKDATDDKPKGILKFKSTTASFSSNSFGTLTSSGGLATLISLIDEGAGGDYRITSDSNRYIRTTINFPGLAIATSGQEDAIYEIGLIENNTVSNALIATWQFSSGPLLYIDRTAGPSGNIFGTGNVVSNISPLLTGNKVNNNVSVVTFATGYHNSTILKTQNANSARIAGGTYSFVQAVTSPLSNYSYYVVINRKQGASNLNMSTFNVLTSSPIQLYVEDIGGTT